MGDSTSTNIKTSIDVIQVHIPIAMQGPISIQLHLSKQVPRTSQMPIVIQVAIHVTIQRLLQVPMQVVTQFQVHAQVSK